ncbi:tRNA (guanosine(46)-N7)-methyltransferase TrmB [Oceanivirga miroungae]|uniref:tRNA (guanine-N(7)-)-methyltransferase n=1 Tax=Oceanivirga miroungae TaxID=1130046 RepID=A0A6I8M949_9FUSO|nr:tRNA (guanosine(46)-N7)-methyltransferase TrmB [Oceanivirga miroungae]VWL85335.1 tRNA (guanine-N(7)-)-methyltransferase [Oceanivirga miroungae]
MIEYKNRELWTYFFTKPRSYYNKYMYEMVNYPDYLIFDREEIENNKSKWNEVYDNKNTDIYLEIGSGSGNFSIELAKRNPNVNLLCDELRLKRLVYSARKAKKEDLKNIKYIKYDANNLTDFLSENEISGLYINFPDPWTGQEHKRMLGEKLLENLDVVLKKNGKIFFKTDHDNYYESVVELINKSDKYEIVVKTDDLYSNEKLLENNIQTEFEHLFIHKLKIKIKYIEIIKL